MPSDHAARLRPVARIPAHLPGFEVEQAVARMLDRPELWWQALGLFVEHFADWEKRWDDAASPAEERRCIHALRSAAANVGAHDLSCLAGQLETLLAHHGEDDAEAPAGGLREQLRDAFRQLWQTACVAHFGPIHPFPPYPA